MKHSLSMKELPLSEKPYELLEEKGADALTDAQLLAILLQSGTREESALTLTQRLLSDQKDLLEGDPLISFLQLPLSRMREYKGIGKVRAIQLKAVYEIARRVSTRKPLPRIDLDKPSLIAELLYPEVIHLRREKVWYLLVDSQLNLLSKRSFSEGGVNSTLVDTSSIFRDGLDKGAYGFILVHNHPGGDPSPSDEDLSITRRLIQQGDVMNLPLLDHIILGANSYYSFRSDQSLDL